MSLNTVLIMVMVVTVGVVYPDEVLGLSREDMISALLEVVDHNRIPELLETALRQQPERNLTKCDLQLQAVVDSMRNSSTGLWVFIFAYFKVFDAWGKFPSGIMEGNFYDLGSYEECRKFAHHDERLETISQIRGRYCLLSIPLKMTLGRRQAANNTIQLNVRGLPSASQQLALMIGTCFPDSCDDELLNAFLNDTFSMLLNSTGARFTCDAHLADIGATEIVAITIFSLIVGLVVFCTIYEVYSVVMASQEPCRTLIIFSMYSNGIKLFQMVRRPVAAAGSQKSDVIDCLNGIRVISMAWIIFSHNYLMLMMSPLNNKLAIYDWVTSYHSMLVLASTVSVDSFFLLSGLLVCCSLLRELDKNRKLNLPLMYLHRYLRLTPAFAALILLTVSFMKYLGSGPFWNSTLNLLSGSCETYWWSALLYLQNYVNPKKICLGNTWYLSVDMQLFLLSPLIVYPLWRWGRKVLLVIAGLILLAMGSVMAIFLVEKIRLAFVAAGSGGPDRMTLTYYPTHTRMGAWLIGVILGYVLHTTKNRRVTMAPVTVVFGWVLSLSMMLAIIFGDYPLQQPKTYMNLPLSVNAIYEGTNRVVWACCLGWIVFACVNGYGGPVNTLLSLTIWQPLGRLSYSMYLLHLPLQALLTASLKNSIHFGDMIAVHKFWGDFGLTVTLAIVWSLLFESPIVGLEKILFGFLRKTEESRKLPVVEENSSNDASNSTASLNARQTV
ncbi:nose resistant to fluoxetine protein 6-like [Sabethes cyaneus]|uniref:nose resistant to fluoxetine protein 6-like n=1 Tax=Sabethes cyaneus TaxID=53552 RepID=UPI00237D9F30|nr:nose resistant to fluoxetine protein 6-like [Sabethes cyaneus]